MGMVLVYRTTGVLNIALAGVGVRAGLVRCALHTLRAWPDFAAIITGIAVAVASGLLFERFIVRKLAAPALATVATLGLFRLLRGLVFVVPWWGNTWGQAFDSPFRTWKPVSIPGANYAVSWDQLVLFGNVIAFGAGLYFILRRTRVGLAMRAVSDDPTAARLMGIRQRLVSPVVWGLAFGLSGLTTMLLDPILNLDNTSLTAFTRKALTVTFVGGLTSLPLTVLGAFALSGLEVWSQLYMREVKGLSDAWPFIMLIVVLMVRFARGTKELEDTAVAPA